MTLEVTGTPAVSAPTPEVAVVVAPEPGSPEHRAAMVAAYDAQFSAPVPPVMPVAAEPVVDPAVVVPIETPAVTETPEAPKDGETPPDSPSLSAMFEDGSFSKGFAAEVLPDVVKGGLEKAGFKPEQVGELHKEYLEGRAAKAELAAQKIHQLAGGPEQFAQLNTWAHSNLTDEQRSFYNEQLSGPMAAEAMAVLKQRAAIGSDPRLVTVNAGGRPPVLSFRDSAEMQTAMSDPRYATSPAFRAEVGERLRNARF